MERIVLFHNSDLPDTFTDELAARGIQASTIDVLCYEFDTFQPQLQKILTSLRDYVGIALPSPRAVEATARVRDFINSDCEIYCVGPKTAAEVERKLGKGAMLIGTKGAAQLCSQITHHLRNHTGSRTVLYISGDIQSTLPISDYEAHGINLVNVVGYSTREVDAQILASKIELTSQPSAVVFFSPSGVRAVMTAMLLQRTSWDLGAIKLFAIGETTGNAVREHFGKCEGWPEASNLHSVKEMLIDRLGR